MNYYYPQASVIEVSGRDAARYLQARLSNDVASLTPGANILAAALNHQGRPLALFNVLLQQDFTYLLVAEGPKNEETLAALLQFKVADDVKAVIREDYKVIHTPTPKSESDKDSVATLTRQRIDDSGHDIVCENPEAFISNDSTQISDDEVFKRRVIAGLPEYPAEISPTKVLTESGMKEAVSFRKGCYIGQEVLERIDSQGKAPSLLLSYKSTQEVLPDQKVIDADNGSSIGNIISASSSSPDDSYYCFVRIRNKGALPQTLTSEAGTELELIKNCLSTSN